MAHGDRANFKQQGGGNMRAFGQTLDGDDVTLLVDSEGRQIQSQTVADLLREILDELRTANSYLAIIADEEL